MMSGAAVAAKPPQARNAAYIGGAVPAVKWGDRRDWRECRRCSLNQRPGGLVKATGIPAGIPAATTLNPPYCECTIRRRGMAGEGRLLFFPCRSSERPLPSPAGIAEPAGQPAQSRQSAHWVRREQGTVMTDASRASRSGDDRNLPDEERSVLERARCLIPRLAERAPEATAARK